MSNISDCDVDKLVRGYSLWWLSEVIGHKIGHGGSAHVIKIAP